MAIESGTARKQRKT